MRDRVIGSVSADLTTSTSLGRARDRRGRRGLAARGHPAGSAVVAFMNPGGVRARSAAGAVTYGEAFTVQPFGNTLVTLTLTGAQLKEVLEQQWSSKAAPRVLLPSAGVHFTYVRGRVGARRPACEGATKVERPDHRRRRGRPDRELPGDGEQVPRRRRRRVHGAARRHRPRGRGCRHRRARGLPGAVTHRNADRAAGARPDRRDALRSAARAAQ